jgi:hypothetical protein
LFNNQENDEADFCESYKSQVLGKDTAEKSTSLFSTIIKLLTILILLALIIGVSYYGYNYFMHNQKTTTKNLPLPPVSIQVSEDDLVITEENETSELIAVQESEDVNSTNDTNEKKETNSSEEEIRLEIPSPTPEAQYLEELADLSKEIDKESKK